MLQTIEFKTTGQGLYEITDEVKAVLKLAARQKSSAEAFDGLCTVFIQHTSASLIIQENADPSARHDLERFLLRLVPENQPEFTHVFEGPDDMPSHIKAVLTQTSIGIPFSSGKLCLGTWQGIYLWEHRRAPLRRSIVVQVLSS